ncbi:MAG: transcriptional regulator domain-containing protein [Parasphingorhabdus sp.]
MSKALDWRSPDFAKDYARHDYADFAQEFLTRNKNYRREYYETLARISEHDVDAQEEMEVLARRWGMIFPL